MSNSLILEKISKSELKDLISHAVAEQLSKSHQAPTPAKETAILTRKQAAKMLGVALSTLHEWTKNGIIQGTR